MTRIFISHSHSDEVIADLLIDFLVAAMEISQKDIRCTSDPNHGFKFSPKDINEQLKDDLKNAGALIVIATIDSLKSPWILFEVGSFWTTDKVVAPIVGPGLSFDDLPGPLKGYRSIQIETEDVEFELNELINQLTDKLSLKQFGVTRRRANKLKAFIKHLRAWKSKLPEPNLLQQKEITELTQKLQESEELIQQLEEQVRSHQEQLEELEATSQQEKDKLKQSLESEIQQLKQQLEQAKEQNETDKHEIIRLRELVERSGKQQLEVKELDTNQVKSFTEDLGNGIKLEMIAIPGGKFLMGSPEGEGHDDEKPQHEVTVQAFYMGKYPITQAQYQEVMGNNPSQFSGNKRPVECVSWDDAVEFCQKLSKQTGTEYRLPTEAEWEYVCRAGTTTAYYFGDTITEKLVNYYQTVGETTSVGKYPPNNFGLYDMHGNVWEWCQDNCHDNYDNAPNDSSAWITENSSNKVMRGGSWVDTPGNSRSAFRVSLSRDVHDPYIGFRVVCVAPRAT
ncbi:MAG: SUMF1/EgtB/PvdO family nonheme iron enzyme [Xenococcus sp. (in: cyanobacteria)]